MIIITPADVNSVNAVVKAFDDIKNSLVGIALVQEQVLKNL